MYNNNELMIYSQQALAAQESTNSLILEFINYQVRAEKTTLTYMKNLKQFATWLKYEGIQQPTREDILAYQKWLESEHDAITLDNNSPLGWSYRTDAQGQPLRVKCSVNTVMQYLRSVKQFFKWAEAEHKAADITKTVKLPKVNKNFKKDALQADDVLTIEQSIQARTAERTQKAAQAPKDTAGRIQRSNEQGKRLYAMYLLAVNAGLRTIEISRANIKDFVEIKGQAWLYIQGKGHREADEKKPLAPEVAEALKEYIESRTDSPTEKSPLFVSTGNRSKGKRIAATTISTMLKRAMQEAGFNSERLTAHSLRHTAGTNVMEITGHNIYYTQEYMRHMDPKTTEIYLHTDTDKKNAAIAQDLYNHYHNKQAEQTANTIDVDKLAKLLTLSADKLNKVLNEVVTA